MKFFILIVLFLSSLSDASDFVSPLHAPLQSPMLSPMPEPSKSHSDCSSVIYDMMDCLSFLLVGSTDSSPTKSCCVGIKSVVDYNPQCLCYGIKSSEAMGFALDNTKAFAMPSICSVSVDPHCEVASSAAPTPHVSPAAAPPSTSPSSKKSPATTPSLPTVTPSSPTATKPPVATASSPAATLSPAVTASSPAPSPSKSSSWNLSASKLFLAAIIVSSFAHVLA